MDYWLNSKFVKHNFFVITSDNCSNVESRLYGYAIEDGAIYIDGSAPIVSENAIGVYVNVVRNNQKIQIWQDYNGSYGLYLYQNHDFFAISNSFLYILHFLKSNHQLSLNANYTKYFLVEHLASLSVEETLLNEIKILHKNSSIEIDISSKKLHIKNNPIQNQKLKLDSKDGIKILDDWYNKWQNILVSLYKNEQNIIVDLTGGMDSRAAFSIFNTNLIDLNKIRVNTSMGKFHTHPEDYEIASLIADRLGFSLNKKIKNPTINIPSELSIYLSFLSKLGIHKEMFFPRSFSTEKVFRFTGAGGESIREHWSRMTVEDFFEDQYKNHSFVSVNYFDAIKNIIDASVKKVTHDYVDNKTNIMQSLYENTRLRTHFGRNNVEKFLCGQIHLNPLMDRELQKIHTNDDTLVCVIYDRYLKELSDIGFDSGKILDPFCLQKAQRINRDFPYIYQKINQKHDIKIVDRTENYINSRQNEVYDDPIMLLKDQFLSTSFQDSVVDFFGHEIYHKAYLNWNREGYFTNRLAITLLAIMLVKSKIKEENDLSFAPHNQMVLKVLDFFQAARIDIKNILYEDNDVTINTLSSNNSISLPQWFQSNGIGYVIESSNLHFEATLTPVQNGTLTIVFRGVDRRDSQNLRIPAWVDLLSFKINGDEKLSSLTSVWHDKPYKFSLKVKSGQKIHLALRWKPYEYTQKDFISIIQQLFDDLPFRPIKR